MAKETAKAIVQDYFDLGMSFDYCLGFLTASSRLEALSYEDFKDLLDNFLFPLYGKRLMRVI